jgi:hypothetical protein
MQCGAGAATAAAHAASGEYSSCQQGEGGSCHGSGEAQNGHWFSFVGQGDCGAIKLPLMAK